MASQTDKKEEFRRYLEKSNVLATLTNILTDLFEMEMRPDDPGQYIYQKFGESLGKSPGSPSQPKDICQEVKRGDSSSNHVTPTPTTEAIGSSKSIQDLPQVETAPNKIDIVMSDPSRDADQTATTNAETQLSRPDQTQGQEGLSALPNPRTSTLTAKENVESSIAQDSLGESSQPGHNATVGQRQNLAARSANSSEQNSGEHITSNTSGLPVSPSSAQ